QLAPHQAKLLWNSDQRPEYTHHQAAPLAASSTTRTGATMTALMEGPQRRRTTPRTRTALARAMSLILALCTGVLIPAPAHAQPCQGQWLPSGDVLAGFNGPSTAVITWDPDGPGPQTPLLVAGGTFTVAADV